jgi:hypothetical protein
MLKLKTQQLARGQARGRALGELFKKVGPIIIKPGLDRAKLALQVQPGGLKPAGQ